MYPLVAFNTWYRLRLVRVASACSTWCRWQFRRLFGSSIIRSPPFSFSFCSTQNYLSNAVSYLVCIFTVSCVLFHSSFIFIVNQEKGLSTICFFRNHECLCISHIIWKIPSFLYTFSDIFILIYQVCQLI